ncbi:family 16 glycosylhydrolase [Zunongwangia pacifica]|uniref:Family 16 glycosylhydrolase n=1 Tax=Zunongwangia pacifica TaxID=2911062 RepID=A0A9X2CP76_9FLAO|nr:family 16 glycosylhydrolase [Zunongwangia pacifica]MCL6219614.1 family 16 glycosylhydrolase [Zunongwangia pacifica]
MKNFKYILGLMIILGSFFQSCQDDDHTFGEVVAPSNLTLEATVMNADEDNPYGDGSGKVSFSAQAENAMNYKFTFGDNTSANITDGDTIHAFTKTGINDYVVTVLATGRGGATTSETIMVTVYSEFDDPETKSLLTGDDSKTWYIAAAMPSHLALGPIESKTSDWYNASPFEKKDGCFYDDSMTFSLDENGNILYELDNSGATFFNTNSLSAAGGTNGTGDECFGYDTSGVKNVSLSAAPTIYTEDETTGTQMMISDGGFLSYYLGTSTYEILEIEEDYMQVRTQSGGNAAEAWYLKLTTNPEGGAGGGNNSAEGKELETEFENLVWEEEFDGSTLDTDSWNFETGNGDNGWGNNEKQYYTAENVVVSDGTLKINAIAESTNGFDYSSARITTMDKQEFKYGRVEVRAKLPEESGTWPAIWMLGSNFAEVGWPASGEIDIMEHVGNDLGRVLGTLHMPGNSGGEGISKGTDVENVASEFHTYTLEWTADHILFAVDNVVFHEYKNNAETPFNQPFFLILNVAMGGTLGGEIDPNFTQDTMEVDYVKVFQ